MATCRGVCLSSGLPCACRALKVDIVGSNLGSAIYQLGGLEEAASLSLYQLPSTLTMLLDKHLQNFGDIY